MSAPRIDVPELRRLPALADPNELLRRLGVDMRGAVRQQGGVTVRCVALDHKDNTPSLSVTRGPDGTVRFRCFGCGASGDALGFVALVNGLDAHRDFARVCEIAAELAGAELPTDAASVVHRDIKPEPEAASKPRPSNAALSAIVDVLARLGRLDGAGYSAEVCEYLGARHLLAAAIADGWFALPHGDASADLSAWLREVACSAHEDVDPEHRPAFDAGDVEASGLLGRSGFAWPRNVLCIPWRDALGCVATLQRRRLDLQTEQKYVFPAGRSPVLPYGIERLRPAVPIVFCEGAVDVLARRTLDAARGVDRVVLGVPGTNGWQRRWAELARGRVAVLATDADIAGDRAAERWAADLHAAGAARVERLRPAGGANDWSEVLIFAAKDVAA